MSTDHEHIRCESKEFNVFDVANREEQLVKEYRVKFWHQDQDGREESFECDSLEQAREFCHGLNGVAVIQMYNEECHTYEDVII